MFAQFRPKLVSKSKNYRYFFRGQYEVVADSEDLLKTQKTKKQRLQPYEQNLKRFEYKSALNSALQTRNPEIVLTLIEELVERGGV
jgi:U3 small nucleolar RNA-associated protein 15